MYGGEEKRRTKNGVGKKKKKFYLFSWCKVQNCENLLEEKYDIFYLKIFCVYFYRIYYTYLRHVAWTEEKKRKQERKFEAVRGKRD